MTDERVHIWNLIHDGEITAVSPLIDEAVSAFVSIPCLRRAVAPLGYSFVLVLSGITLVEFHHFGGKVSSLQEALEYGGPEILSTSSQAMPLAIEATMGRLSLDFRSMRIELDTGQPIEYPEIERLAEQYWSAWQARADAQLARRAKW